MKIKLAEIPHSSWQGEMPLLGTPVKIARFHGCNLGNHCPVECDTKFSWMGNPIEADISDLKFDRNEGLMITGGEPFIQFESMIALIDAFNTSIVDLMSPVIVETNGTLIGPNQLVELAWVRNLHISISPKTDASFGFLKHSAHRTLAQPITLKVVVGANHFPDHWAHILRECYWQDCKIVLQPEGTSQEHVKSNLVEVQKFAKLLNVPYTLSPRMHIFLGVK